MREILFRGKRVDNGKWVEGWLFKRYVRPSDVPPFCYNPYIHDVEVVDAVQVYDGENVGSIEYYNVIPETVSEYTGQKDKNSRRIFEGDIVKIPDDYDTYGINAGEVYEVYFGFGGFRLKPKYRKNARGFFLEDDGEVEVIGNIFDNPELLFKEE